MKVVLFCGGLGLRLRDYAPRTPKPLVPVGRHALLWNLMRYYAHYGHTDFILCLGHNAAAFEHFFKCGQGKHAAMAGWRVTCADTGLDSNLGQRLLAVRPYLQDEPSFLVNYADVLTDLPLPDMLASFQRHGRVASFLAYQPTQSFHVASLAADGQVQGFSSIASTGLWVNAGFMAVQASIFDYLGPGEELVEQPFQRLIAAHELMAYRYEGFWASMDTLKDKLLLDQLSAQSHPPWEVWRSALTAPAAVVQNQPEERLPHHAAAAVPAACRVVVPGLPTAGLRVLCLGAHCDDIEIGAGGTLLRLLAAGQVSAVRWVVLAATDERAREAQASAAQFLACAPVAEVTVHRYADGLLPQAAAAIKADFEALKEFAPNLILTHYRHDLHQDHRLVSDLTWNTFRNHLIWEYEIPKFDDDLGNPTCFVALTAAELARKVALLLAGFPSQAGKHWFDAETFRALPRLRGIQSGGGSAYAEAFYVRKWVL